MRSNKYKKFEENPDGLIADLSNGNIQAFHFVFDEYYRSLLLFAKHILSDDHLAEDIVQDTFIKLWERNDQFSAPSAIKAFLYLTVKNSCIDQYRHSRTMTDYKQKQIIAPDNIPEETIEKQLIEAETVRIIKKAINELPPQCQNIFRLGLTGLKNQEIAIELDLSINTVKTQKKRALSILRQKLGNDFFIIMLLYSNFF